MLFIESKYTASLTIEALAQVNFSGPKINVTKIWKLLKLVIWQQVPWLGAGVR